MTGGAVWRSRGFNIAIPDKGAELRLVGWTRSDRHEVTACVTDLITDVGGFVLDSQRFSNQALMLRFEIPEGSWVNLVLGVQRCSVTLDNESAAIVESRIMANAGVGDDATATLHIRFVHDEPDLRIETPAVPG